MTNAIRTPKFAGIWPSLLGKQDKGAHQRKGAGGDGIDRSDRAAGIEGGSEVARRKQPEGSRGVGFDGGCRVTGIYQDFSCGEYCRTPRVLVVLHKQL
jgi:hypothetical protein